MFKVLLQRSPILGSKLRQKPCKRCWQNIQRFSFSTSFNHHGVYEPDNINLPPEIPELDVLLIKLKGFDYVVLESYAQRSVGLTRNKFGLDASLYPYPAMDLEVKTFHPNSSKVENEYKLSKFERVLKVKNVQSTKVALLVETLKLTAPPGVEFTVKQGTEEDERDRLKPDHRLHKLIEEFQEVGGKYTPPEF